VGYDILIIEHEPPNREHVELDAYEHEEILAAATRMGLPILSGFPHFWGECYQIDVQSFPVLLSELDRVDSLAGLPASAHSAVELLRKIVKSANSRGLPIEVVPD